LVATNLLKVGILPVFNENDVLSAEEIAYDNDQLAAMVATALRADKLVILTDVDGVYDKQANDSDANLILEVRNLEELDAIVSGGKSAMGRGHMKTKLEAARLVTAFGVEVIIANGKRPDVLRSILSGENGRATIIRASGPKLKQRKSWIALTANSRGDISVSTFFAEALAHRKPASVLLIGVEQVAGSFRPNDIVTVKDLSGRVLGRGEVRFSSDELREKIARRERGEDVDFLGTEVIHRDYFVLAPPNIE
jgi:glutamate 5-kinase